MEGYKILAEKFIAFGFVSELLALRETCRDACLTITQTLVEKNREHPIVTKRTFICMSLCMSCNRQGSMKVYQHSQSFCVFCPKSIMCRIGALISATEREIFFFSSWDSLKMRPIKAWNYIGPFNILRSSGEVDPGWEIINLQGMWVWDIKANDIRLSMRKLNPKRPADSIYKWCWLKDLFQLNKNFTLPPGDFLYHTPYSFGCEQNQIEEALLKKANEYGIILQKDYSLPSFLNLTYTPY